MDAVITLHIDLSNGADKPDAGLQTRTRLLEFCAINNLTSQIYKYTEGGHVIAGPDGEPIIEDEAIIQVVEKIVTNFIGNAVAQKRAEIAANKARQKMLEQEMTGR